MGLSFTALPDELIVKIIDNDARMYNSLMRAIPALSKSRRLADMRSRYISTTEYPIIPTSIGATTGNWDPIYVDIPALNGKMHTSSRRRISLNNGVDCHCRTLERYITLDVNYGRLTSDYRRLPALEICTNGVDAKIYAICGVVTRDGGPAVSARSAGSSFDIWVENGTCMRMLCMSRCIFRVSTYKLNNGVRIGADYHARYVDIDFIGARHEMYTFHDYGNREIPRIFAPYCTMTQELDCWHIDKHTQKGDAAIKEDMDYISRLVTLCGSAEDPVSLFGSLMAAAGDMLLSAGAWD